MSNLDNNENDQILNLEQSTLQESLDDDYNDSVKDFISFDDILTKRMKFGKAQYLCFITIALCWIAEGSELVLNPLLNLALKQQESWGISESEQNWLTTGLFLGFLIGAIPSGYFGDKYGRKNSTLVILIIMTIFGIASGFSWNIYVLIVFRFIFGILVGLCLPIIVTLTIEITPMAFRGKLLVITVSFFVVGELIVVLFALIFFSTLAKAKWHEMIICLQIFKLISVFTCWKFCSESPRYLFYVGRTEEAIKVTNYFIKANNKNKKKNVVTQSVDIEDRNMMHEHLSNPSIDDDNCLELKQEEIDQLLEWNKLQKVINEGEQQNQSSWKQILCNKQYLLLTLKLGTLWFALTVAYYGLVYTVTTILDEKYESGSGLSDEDKKNKQFIELLMSTAIELPSYIGAAYLIENASVGRKKIMICGFSVAILSSMFIFSYRAMSETLYTVVASIARFFFSGTFVTLQPFSAELYPTSIRNKGYGLSSGASRFGGILLTWILQAFYKIDYTGPYLLFAILAAMSLVVLIFLPETQGQELDTLQVQKAELAEAVKSIRKSIAQSFKESQVD